MRVTVLIAVGNLGRWLYEWADRRLELADGDPPDVIGQARYRWPKV